MKQKRLSGQLIKKNGSYRIAEPVDSIVKILGIILSLSWKVARYGSRGKTTNILPSRKLVGTEISLINNHIEGYGDIRARASEKEQAILTLYDNGMIRDCNPPSEELLNCSSSELVGQHIVKLLPQLEGIKLVQGKRVNSYLRYLSYIGCHFEVVSMNGEHFEGELLFSDVESSGQQYLRITISRARQGSSLAIYY